MYDGFYKEWLVSIVAYGIIGRATGLGWSATIAVAVVFGFLTAISFYLLPILRVPVDFVTALVLVLVVNTLLIYVATGLLGIGDRPSSLQDAFWGGVGVSVIRGLVRGLLDRVIPEG